MIIQHNMSSVIANGNLNKTKKRLRVSTQRLSTGYRINSSADDAAGLTISEKMRWQIRGLNRASDNIQDGISLLQVADGATQEVHMMLQRMKELAVQGANDTNTAEDRAAIQKEIDQIKNEINRISSDTEFNEIKIFKPTNVPEIKGNPTDILVYHEDYNGGVREGGIIYSGKRYAYEDMDLAYDANGNIKAGTYDVTVFAEDGINMVTIPLMFDGGDRVPSGREYKLDPKEDGIYIDKIQHKWENIKDAGGTAFDPSNIKEGTYSFQHAGLTISFDVDADMDFDSLLESLKKDGLETYMLRSSDVSNINPYITPTVTITSIPLINAAKQDYVPGSTSSNYNSYPAGYNMYADDNEIYMYIDAANSMTGNKEILTRMTWDDLGLNEWKRYNPDSNYHWVNPGGTVTGGERSQGYTYHDSITGISINFTVDSEVSKGELIRAINDWKINVNTNNRMIFTPSTTGSIPITAGTHSSSLDAYGTHYAMGRTMSTTMTLTTNQQLAYSGDQLSFTMKDAKGTVYTFSASSVTSRVKSRVESDLRSYISSYASNYESRLNGYSSTLSSSRTGSLSFSSDTGGYSMALDFTENFSGWLSDSNFSRTYNSTTKRWEVSYNSSAIVNSLSSNITALANNIVDSLKKTKISINTDTGSTTATNTVSRSLGTNNKRYSSLSVSGEREVKIQAGCQQNQYIAIKLPPMNTAILKIGGVDVSSHDSASSGISSIDKAIDYVSDMRAGYGATQNRLEAAMSVDDITAENTQAAESLLRDADMAEESIAYARNSILLQAGQSVLAQANHQRDNILSILS
ncbi:MAG: hypothetical protein K2N34_11945 [Lachnospiraceae bacterium]|nr:hypothetical protein [Lachnospiraceae bacterium]